MKIDRIYVAKYCDKIDISEIAYSFNKKTKDIRECIKEMKEEGVFEKYKNMSDEEWEKKAKKI